jgi:hypothetical protein
MAIRSWCSVESQNLGGDGIDRAGVDPFAGATEAGQVLGRAEPGIALVRLGQQPIVAIDFAPR